MKLELIEVEGKLKKFNGFLNLKCNSFAILGDTHGYPEVTEWFIQKYLDNKDCLFLLGDYVDRGPRGTENLELVLETFLTNDNVFLLRGNHEDHQMNIYYGFWSEVLRKRSSEYYENIKRIYKVMPLGAIVNSEFFLVHGGIPCRVCVNRPEPPLSIDELMSIAYSYISRDKDPIMDKLLFQLLWNDPDPYLDWYAPNIRGEGTYLYGHQAWKTFLQSNMLRTIIRAHEKVNGVLIYYPTLSSRDAPQECVNKNELAGAVITVFSSLYHGMLAGAVIVEKEYVCFDYYS